MVKPGQAALFIYNGQIADIFAAGNHEIKTENVPLLTRLSNWKFGFESPLRCELVFFSLQIFSGLRWGTPSPVLMPLSSGQTIPVRGYGTYNLQLNFPAQFFKALMGTRATMELSDVQMFVQSQIQQALPQSLSSITQLSQLNAQQATVAKTVENLTAKSLLDYGLKIGDVKVISLVPPDDTMQALGDKAAMQVIGDPQKYLLYKMANSLGSPGKENSNVDPMQMMMSLMVGRGLMGMAGPDKAPQLAPVSAKCKNCGSTCDSGFKFCPHCGEGMNP